MWISWIIAAGNAYSWNAGFMHCGYHRLELWCKQYQEIDEVATDNQPNIKDDSLIIFHCCNSCVRPESISRSRISCFLGGDYHTVVSRKVAQRNRTRQCQHFWRHFWRVSLLQGLKSPWALFLTKRVPEVVEIRPADWPEHCFSG